MNGMQLKFLGRGSAFNPKEGSNSAYFIDDNCLFLIDCGETVFSQLIKKGLLTGISAVYLLITHTHADHIGSLGSLVAYVDKSLHKKVQIVMPRNPKHWPNIKNILDGTGCLPDQYDVINEANLDNRFSQFNAVRYVETKHCDELNCYGLIFTTPTGTIYYSGDTTETAILESILSESKPFYRAYVDVTTLDYPGNVHLYVGELAKAVAENLRDKIYCMHFNNDACIKQAHELGFGVVEVEK